MFWIKNKKKGNQMKTGKKASVFIEFIKPSYEIRVATFTTEPSVNDRVLPSDYTLDPKLLAAGYIEASFKKGCFHVQDSLRGDYYINSQLVKKAYVSDDEEV